MVLWFRISQCGRQIYTFLNNCVSNLPPIGEKLLVVVLGLVLFHVFISSLDGYIQSILMYAQCNNILWKKHELIG